AYYILLGLILLFDSVQSACPCECAQRPNPPFCAVGGCAVSIAGAVDCQHTLFAAVQPSPFPSCPRLPKRNACPSISTISNSPPDAQLSIVPLKLYGSTAWHCTNAFGPAAV